MLGWLRRGGLIIALFMVLVVPLLTTAQATPIEPIEVRVMAFNVWVGGELVDFGKVAESIAAASADVVLLQEAGGNTRAIAELLGWPHVSERMQVISRFPLIDPAGADGDYIYVQTAPGNVFAVANVHLPSDPYGPYLIRDGSSLEEVMQNEADTRMPVIEEHLGALADLLDSGVPTILAGDFNTPSHLDWTEATMAMRPEMAYLVEWPVSLAVEAAGFVDTYRAVYPDPAERLGMTWTYGYPYPRLREDEVIDRIDFIYASDTIEILDSQIVGPAGTPDVDYGLTPYPSDHRAVVTTLMVTPVEPPLFASMDRRVVQAGEHIVVRYHIRDGEATDRVFIVPADEVLNDDAILMSLPPMEAEFFGAVTFGSHTLAPGAYDAVAGNIELEEYARARFWVVAPDAVPVVSTDQVTYTVGAPIVVSWENLPANRWDWIGIYLAGDPDLYNYYAFAYTDSQSSGTISLDVETIGELEPGAYVVRVMEDDWYVMMAEAEFTVSE